MSMSNKKLKELMDKVGSLSQEEHKKVESLMDKTFKGTLLLNTILEETVDNPEPAPADVINAVAEYLYLNITKYTYPEFEAIIHALVMMMTTRTKIVKKN